MSALVIDLEPFARFGETIVFTWFEFENIPADALDVISATTPLFPDRRALETSQERNRPPSAKDFSLSP